MSLFHYGNGKRKIEHSKFDQGFNNLSTDTFGQLSTKAVYEVLPDDFWSIGQHTLTKVEPMVCPPFTRIHQNWYAFYVKNQQIWKHWNDYITNGTAYGQVYGSNATNQKRDNPWQIPQIQVPDLMLPCKIASGFAIPVYRFSFPVETFRELFGLGSDDLTFLLPDKVTTNDVMYHEHRITDLIALIFSKFPLFRNLPYFEGYYYQCPYPEVYINLELSIPDSIYTQVLEFFNLDTLEPSSFSSDNGHDMSDEASIDPQRYITFRLFADSASSDVSQTNSPFVLQRKVVTSKYNNYDLNTFEYSQRHDLDNYFPVADDNVSLMHNFVGIDSRFWGKKYYFKNGDSGGSAQNWISNFHPASDVDAVTWRLRSGWLGLPTDQTMSADEISDFLHTVPAYLGVTTAGFSKMLDGLEEFKSDLQFWHQPNPCMSTHSFYDNSTLPSSYSGLQSIGGSLFSDVVLPIYVYSDDFNSSDLMYFAPPAVYQSRLTDSLGYYSVSWLVYNCKLVLRHLDDMGLPVDAYCVRNHFDYRYESVNALPFFAYSNIWEHHFRNYAVSSPELDYTQTNGSSLLDHARKMSMYVSHRRPSQLPEVYNNADFNQLAENSWVIPFDYKPKNGKPSQYIEIQDNDGTDFRHFIDGRNHYLVIDNYVDLFSILTGQCLDNLALRQMFRSYQKHYNSNGTLDYNTFSSLFMTDFYLPSYYNGLLRQKFQNFNQDYFTSAMLDPMSGANQVALGETINEFRVNEEKQSWFERIAQARSVSDFFRAIFGVTPDVENCASKLLGTDHVDINIGEVIQTSQTTADSPQGSRSGLGQAVGQGGLCHDHCNEHGFILILCSHTVEAQYFQGIDRKYLPKASYMDYPTVDFANIGNESILQKEINYNNAPHVSFAYYKPLPPDQWLESKLEYDGGYDRSVYDRNGYGRQKYDGSGNPIFVKKDSTSYTLYRNITQTSGTSLDNIFGYLPRWTYYKITLDQVHGEFRNKMIMWHTFRKFFSQPVLCHEFLNWERVSDSDELNRIFAVSDSDVSDKFKLDTFINASVSRALPYVCVPKTK